MSTSRASAPSAAPETATGIILRTRPLTETSLIVHWLTAEAGRIATVARGARRPHSPFRGKLDLAFEARLSFARSRRSELHTLREVVVADFHEPLRRDLAHLRQAAYAAALIEQTTETDTPVEEVFLLLRGFLRHLPRQPARPRTVFAFELKLLHELGLAPSPHETRLAPGARDLLARLTEVGWEELGGLTPTAAEVRALQQFLHGFLIFHLGRLPRGRNTALGVAS